LAIKKSTGLLVGRTGLSISIGYDIVTKGHGGELKVKTEDARLADRQGRSGRTGKRNRFFDYITCLIAP